MEFSSAPAKQPLYQTTEDPHSYAALVEDWVRAIPIRLGLCPWAIRSQNQSLLNYVTCYETAPEKVARQLRVEAPKLITCTTMNNNAPPVWSTTLLICPRVPEWNDDFKAFDSFVNMCTAAATQKQNCNNKHKTSEEEQEEDMDTMDVMQQITLVSFHPRFLRWRGLPEKLHVGSIVQSYRPIKGGFQKSQEPYDATLLETCTKMFGRRKAKVQFHNDQKQYYVPNDWIVSSCFHNSSSNGDDALGPELPDNAMHRTPYPTIHLIRNEDLGRLSVRDVSRVKRINAKKMTKLGWEGVQRQKAVAAASCRNRDDEEDE